jgi:hypothetical protein
MELKMNTITQIMINRNYDEKLKYDEHLRKVEQLKIEMAERYLLHPSNYVTKKNWNDAIGDCNVPIHLCRNRATLVIDGWETWGDEKRQMAISQNGNNGEHYYGEV